MLKKTLLHPKTWWKGTLHSTPKSIPWKSKDYWLNGFCVKIVLVRVYSQQFQETILFDYLQASILRQKRTPFGILSLEIRILHPLKFQFFGGVSRCPRRFNQMVSRIKDAQWHVLADSPIHFFLWMASRFIRWNKKLMAWNIFSRKFPAFFFWESI